MKLSTVTRIGFVAVVTTLVAILFASSTPSARANEARHFLESALTQIDIPKPGDVVHYSYSLYDRAPEQNLEPKDPYHLPYKEIWPVVEYEDTWIEIGPDGKTFRWRTQLHNAKGVLLQDLLFDEGIETDYFPLDLFAESYTQEAGVFRDDRVALIEDFLEKEELSRQDRTTPDGELVVSIYIKPEDLTGSTWATETIEEALLSFSRPFVANIQPLSRAIRIDFSQTTLLPVGEAIVVWDKNDNEHVVSYRAYSQMEILSKETAENEGIFHQDIPDGAFSGSYSLPVETVITDLDQILGVVDFPLYVLPETANGIELVSTSLGFVDPTVTIPAFYRNIKFASSLGVGVETIYTDKDNANVVSFIQGPVESMRDLLRQSKPDWIRSEQVEIQLGDSRFSAWELISLEEDQPRYVIEAGETIVFVSGQGLSSEKLLELLQLMVK